jgi:hypothetical protein
MVQEAPHEALIVERHILMQRALGQPHARELRRSDRGGGEEDLHPWMFCRDALDHRQSGIGLADAGRVKPREEA